MSQISGFLILLIFIMAAFQPTDERKFTAFVFSVVAGIHAVMALNLDGIAYYGSAALFDYAVILMIGKLANTSKAIDDIQNICIVSIALNGIGWVMWMAYLDPVAYNAAFISLYAWTIIVLMKRERPHDGRGDKMGAWVRNLLSFSGESRHISDKQ